MNKKKRGVYYRIGSTKTESNPSQTSVVPGLCKSPHIHQICESPQVWTAMGWEGALCPVYGDGGSRTTAILGLCSAIYRPTDLSLWNSWVGSCMQSPLASELGLGVQRDEPWSQAVQAEKNLLVSSGQ